MLNYSLMVPGALGILSIKKKYMYDWMWLGEWRMSYKALWAFR